MKKILALYNGVCYYNQAKGNNSFNKCADLAQSGRATDL